MMGETAYYFLVALVLSVLFMYLILAAQFESWLHPVSILAALPVTIPFGLLSLLLFRQPMDLYAMFGLFMLIGIVKKNGILMIDFALEAQRDHGRDPRAAITEAAILRFRPIMMTTMAALLGALPLVLETGTGSELRQPLGVSVVGGLLLSQVITLYTTPVVYLAMETIRGWAQRLVRRPAPAPAE
jgi:multidrug efflux pump subunit AcrB